MEGISEHICESQFDDGSGVCDICGITLHSMVPNAKRLIPTRSELKQSLDLSIAREAMLIKACSKVTALDWNEEDAPDKAHQILLDILENSSIEAEKLLRIKAKAIEAVKEYEKKRSNLKMFWYKMDNLTAEVDL